MPNYAISDGKKIVNVILADNINIAQEFSEMDAIETEGVPWIGWTLEEEGWRSPSPYPSWSWNGTEWVAPQEKPNVEGKFFVWNEELLSWEEEYIPQPYPSWTLDENGDWIPPIAHPNDGKIYYWDEESQSWILMEED